MASERDERNEQERSQVETPKLGNVENAESGEYRPKVTKYPGNKFALGSEVYVKEGRSMDGPFLVAKVPRPKTYILCEQDGTPVQDGKEFDEEELCATIT